MALFKSQRDAGFFRRINEELINKIYDVRIGYYQIETNNTKSNIYNESVDRYYYQPIWIPALVSRDDYSYSTTDLIDIDQTANFYFLLDTLIDLEVNPKSGDVIEYNKQFYEIDATKENKFTGDSNPHTTESETKYGYNVSIVCETHLTRNSIVNIVNYKMGLDEINDFNLPSNV